MRPLRFRLANRDLMPSQVECCSKEPLPVFTDGNQCVSCWGLSFLDRIRMLLTGRVWVGVMSGCSQPPMWVDSEYPFVKTRDDEREA